MSLQKRVALRYLDAEWDRVAKPVYLKALDFTAGLIRKFNARGQQISKESPNQVLLRRVLQMRAMVQDGFDLGLLVKNDAILSSIGTKFQQLAEAKEAEEELLLPREQELEAFLMVFPEREMAARGKQSIFLKSLISRELGVPLQDSDYQAKSEFDNRLMSDRVLFNEAFQVVNAYIRGVKPVVSSLLSGAPGSFGIRDKAEQSTWDKARKKGVSFVFLGDLIGCRSVTTTIPDMAKACGIAQRSLNILYKDNKYLQTQGGYNAVHYAMSVDHIIVEYQVKAMVNKLEAALSHELIYSDDKFRDKFKMEPLPVQEKALIRRVIDISTQLSMADLKSYFNIPLETIGGPNQDLLYGENMDPRDLEQRLRLAQERMVRFAGHGVSS